MIESIVSALAVAFISALAWIAYRHPGGYKKLYQPLSWLLIAAYCGSQLWSLAVTKTYSSLHTLLAPGNADAADQVRSNLEIDFGWAFLWFTVAYAYIFFLRFLHAILESTPEK